MHPAGAEVCEASTIARRVSIPAIWAERSGPHGLCGRIPPSADFRRKSPTLLKTLGTRAMLDSIEVRAGMTFRRTAIIAAAALLVGAPIASAQHRGGGHGGAGGHAAARGGSGQSGARSASPRSSGAAPRAGGTTERAAPATHDPHAPGTVTGTAVPRRYGAVVRPYGYVGTGVFRGPIT